MLINVLRFMALNPDKTTLISNIDPDRDLVISNERVFLNLNKSVINKLQSVHITYFGSKATFWTDN